MNKPLLWKNFSQLHLLFLSCIKRPMTPQSLLVIRELFEAKYLEDLMRLSVSNKVDSLVVESLIQAIGDDVLSKEWHKRLDTGSVRIRTFISELDRVAQKLHENGVHIIVLENGALARSIYPVPQCYSFGDFDILVKPDQLNIVDEVLISNGYHWATSNNGRDEYRINLQGTDLTLNVQSCLVVRRWFDTTSDPDLEQLFDRSVQVQGSRVRILSPEDGLYQIAIHNASHGYVRKPGVRLHLDIDWYLSACSINWPAFLRLVELCQSKTKVYFSLLITNRLFGTEIPDVVFSHLRPPIWKECVITSWFNRVGLFDQEKPKFNRLSYLFFSSLLYDNFGELFRAFFPSHKWMKEHYKIKNKYLVPFYYFYRLYDSIIH